MYQNSLMQSLNDSKLAELRRAGRLRRSSLIRRDASPRISRPLARLLSH
jgi:hypothetical protein